VCGKEGISRLAVFDIGNSFVANSYGFYIATYHGDTPPCGFRHSLQRVLAIPNLVGWTGGLGCQPEMDTEFAAGTLSLSILAGLVVTLILLSLY
jgi:predicted permease